MLNARCYSQYGCDPYENMAADEWLMEQAFSRPGYVALRLYTWNAGAITFGYNQDVDRAVDYSALNGTPLIRRITGGRALYHDPSELTYAIVVNTTGLGKTRLTGSITSTST